MHSDEILSLTVYQLFLRAFTKEGTLAAATRHLPEICELGVDIVYVCPFMVEDEGEDRAFWSIRQKDSGLDNPKNPYRISDYFHVDPEYGDEKDLRAFVDEVHRLGMKVLFDLVYFHCGPNAVFLKEHPDFVRREKNGEFVLGDWCFPQLNYENPALGDLRFDGESDAILAFTRRCAEQHLYCAVNLSAEKSTIDTKLLRDASPILQKDAHLSDGTLMLDGWGYAVYEI